MSNFNKVILMGNLTRDIEMRYSPTGTAIAKMGLAINSSYTSNGEKKEETTFVDITAFQRQAEVCAEYLEKGDPVLIEGRLSYRQWDTDDGTKRSKLEVVASNVQFLKARSTASAAPSNASQPPSASRAPQTTPQATAPAPEDAPFGPPDDNSDIPF